MSGEIPQRSGARRCQVLALHGRGGTGQIMRHMTEFDDAADRWEFAVAYPDGSRRTWADSRDGDNAGAAADEDVEFLRALITWSAERHDTAPNQTIVAGMSAGAFMGHRLAVQASEHAAVLAAVAGAIPGKVHEVKPSHSVSVLLINDTADPIVPIGSAQRSRRRFRSEPQRMRLLWQQDTVACRSGMNGCRSTESSTLPADPERPGSFRVTRHLATSAIAGTVVSAWKIDGAGHTWPGSNPPRFHLIRIGPTAGDIDANEEICRFAHARLEPATKCQL